MAKGKLCACAGCKKPARVKFCSNKCKDTFHNMNNPRGKFAHLREVDIIGDQWDDADDVYWGSKDW